MSTPPIEEHQFTGGFTVVKIEDLRIARGLSRRPHSACPHIHLVYDDKERRIWCKDCETDVEPFDAFTILAARSHDHLRRLRRRYEALQTAEEHKLLSLAAREVDRVWRTKKMVPSCPSCGGGLLPEDFKHGCTAVSAELTRARRKKETSA